MALKQKQLFTHNQNTCSSTCMFSRFLTLDQFVTFKRPSHGKLKLANSCWQTQVGVCEQRKNSRQTRWQTVGDKQNVLANYFCAVHTLQLEFANTSLPTLVCRVKAALRFVCARAYVLTLMTKHTCTLYQDQSYKWQCYHVRPKNLSLKDN